jgi:hypothetical protein
LVCPNQTNIALLARPYDAGTLGAVHLSMDRRERDAQAPGKARQRVLLLGLRQEVRQQLGLLARAEYRQQLRRRRPSLISHKMEYIFRFVEYQDKKQDKQQQEEGGNGE